MRIDHIAMYVKDLEKARDFLLNISMQHQTRVITIRKLIFAHIF